MTPMTPLIETPNGRLAELVTLLTDEPLHLTFDAVTESDTFIPSQPADPWWIVASALVRLRRNGQGPTPSFTRATDPDSLPEFQLDEDTLAEVLSGLIDLAAA